MASEIRELVERKLVNVFLELGSTLQPRPANFNAAQ